VPHWKSIKAVEEQTRGTPEPHRHNTKKACLPHGYLR